LITFPFTIETATVLLAVEVQGPGDMPAIRVTLAEVGIEKLDPFFSGNSPAGLPECFVLLMGTDEQGGGESIKAVIKSSFCRSGEAETETFPAAFRFVAGDPAEIFYQVIAVIHDKRKISLISEFLHAGESGLVLGIGVDIGVVPERANFIILPTPVFHRIGRAVSAADMDEDIIHNSSAPPCFPV
jgi:hypothetical protein